METGIVNEFEDATAQSSTRNQGPTSAFVAMIACNVMLLVMLAAYSPPAHAQVLAFRAVAADADAFNVAVPLERLTVVPSPEDRPPPAKDRWQRFEEALNAGARSRHHRIIESATNDGIRMSCHEPSYINSCASSGGFSLAGRGFGR